MNIVVDCINLSGNKLHTHVGVDTVSLGAVMDSTLAWNARDVGSIPALSTIFLIFITPTLLVAVTIILYKLCTVSECMVVEPIMCT